LNKISVKIFRGPMWAAAAAAAAGAAAGMPNFS
jgi:hypothetical protein